MTATSTTKAITPPMAPPTIGPTLLSSRTSGGLTAEVPDDSPGKPIVAVEVRHDSSGKPVVAVEVRHDSTGEVTVKELSRTVITLVESWRPMTR